MNFADTEVILGILNNNGFNYVKKIDAADIILLNTCSVRDNAEKRILGRLGNLKNLKDKNNDIIIGVLGCMAERLKEEIIEKKKIVDLVVGPDEYRNLPQLIKSAYIGGKGVGVKLSRVETYDDIAPYRGEGLTAWISIMRGCNRFCSYCVVPYTRGRERSRSLGSIINEIKGLSERGVKEIVFLGQNVNSYKDGAFDFADLLNQVAKIDRKLRIRFTTSHPGDLSEKLLYTIADNFNICKHIHLPVQSGSNRILSLMNRSYTIEKYMNLVDKAKSIIGDISFTTDIISGFPTETEEDHLATLDIMKYVRYDGAFMFKYSPREGTKAFKMENNVSDSVKTQRLTEIIDLQQIISNEKNQELIGKEEIVLIEGYSKKSKNYFSGKTDSNKITVFPAVKHAEIGNYVKVIIKSATSATLTADFISKIKLENNEISLTA